MKWYKGEQALWPEKYVYESLRPKSGVLAEPEVEPQGDRGTIRK